MALTKCSHGNSAMFHLPGTRKVPGGARSTPHTYLRALPRPCHAGTVTHVRPIDEEMEVYVFCDLAGVHRQPWVGQRGAGLGKGCSGQGLGWAK